MKTRERIIRLLCLAALVCILVFGFTACTVDPNDPNGRPRLNGSITACYEGACITYDPRDVSRPQPVQPLPLPQVPFQPQAFQVKDSGK